MLVDNIYFRLRFTFVYQKPLKQMFQPGFLVQNCPLNLCSRAVNSQRLFCSKKASVKYLYLSYINIVMF